MGRYQWIFGAAFALLAAASFIHYSASPIIPTREIASQRPADCEGTPLANKNPVAFLQWLKHNGNKNKSIADVLCCMPEKYRYGYRVAHSSISAQQSHYRSPRIILGDLDDGFLFSVSAGDPSLPQNNSVEVMINNKKKGELEFFDVEYRNQRKIASHKNPDKCVSCHSSGGEIKAGGMRPIFNIAPWPRMITSSVTITGLQEECVERSKFFEASEKVARKAIIENKNLRCLSKGEFGVAPVDTNFDGDLQLLNERRVLKEIESTPNFHRVKPLVIGISKGCFYSPGLSNVQKWVPKDSDISFNDNAFLSTQLKNDPLSDRDFKNQFHKYFESNKRIIAEEEIKFREMRKLLLAGGQPVMDPELGLRSCFFSPEELLGISLNEAIETANKMSSNLNSDHKKYIQDTLLASMKRGDSDAVISPGVIAGEGLMRWVFESRGIDTRWWDLSLIPRNSRFIFALLHNHYREEDSRSCDQLSKASLEALAPKSKNEEQKEIDSTI